MTPFVRLTLIPVLLLFAVGMALMVDVWTPEAITATCFVSGGALLGSLWLAFPSRLWWAGRVLAALVFVLYVAYFAYEILLSSNRWRLIERRSAASPRNALIGLIVIGIPCLWYALGRPGRSRDRPHDTVD